MVVFYMPAHVRNMGHGFVRADSGSYFYPCAELLEPPSMTKSASFVTMFSVFSAAGVLGNAMIMVRVSFLRSVGFSIMPDTTPLYAYKMMCILQLTSILVWSQDLAFLVASANVVIFLALSGGFVPFPYIEDWIVWLQW